ncbi:hypothetical protein L226DRAFT_568503 [Lentinus tigrinus ALCF2SS1-7]|uniref:uncharacterized protein n=1 Tax=Lentinus tigrinus ALCF2SS1-7 TaxID=1328758 RepID=UPI001165EE82|nr:hypothetical protein L226DRAFT_568503 [Lentinus tigrinus ALCF2SS1-7]
MYDASKADAMFSNSISTKRPAQKPAAVLSKSRGVEGSLSASTSMSVTPTISSPTKTTIKRPSAPSLHLGFTSLKVAPRGESASALRTDMSKKRSLEAPVAGPSSKIRRLNFEPQSKVTDSPTQLKIRHPFVDFKSTASTTRATTSVSRKPLPVASKAPAGPSSSTAVSSLQGSTVRSSPPKVFKKVHNKLRLKNALSSPFTFSVRAGAQLRDKSSAPQPREQVHSKAPDEDSSDDATYRCSSCGDTMYTNRDMCMLCQMAEFSSKNVPRKDPRPALVPTVNATNAPASSSSVAPAPAPAPQSKPRPQRMTKKMRQREFESWFGTWTKGYRGHPEQRASTEDKTDYWRDEQTREEGGTVYPTTDAFFFALQHAWTDQQVGKARGGTQVVEFYGAYSIVAQPRINAATRHGKIRERMRQMGFDLDADNYGRVYFKRTKPDSDLPVTDNVYKYPCSCGGSSVPPRSAPRQKHRAPDAQYVGPCGGTVMILVGRDDSLSRPGFYIPGQRIAVDIVH